MLIAGDPVGWSLVGGWEMMEQRNSRWMGRIVSHGVNGALYGLFCLIGLFIVLHPTVLSGFSQMPGEPGDTRLNQYFLEHSWRWISDRAYSGTLYSPSFYYPYGNALAFSDNLFGTAPLYWGLRTLLSPDSAFVAWLMAISSLNFAAMAYVLRRWQVRPLLASLGGFVFAFSAMRIARLPHVQLFPHFATPLALWVAWEFFHRPRKRSFCLLLLLIYWQLLCGIYLGWFLCLGLLVLAGVAIVRGSGTGRNLIQFFAKSWRTIGTSLIIWGVALYGLLAPYLAMKRVLGGRSYEEISPTLPQLNSWLAVPPQGNLWSQLLSPFLQGLSMVHEHFIFTGFVLAGLMVGVIHYRWSRSAWLPVDRKNVMMGFAIAAGVMMALSLAFPSGISLWRVVYQIVPGASVIRAVARIGLIILPCLLIAGFVWLEGWLSRVGSRQLQILCLIPLTVLTLWEQILVQHPSYDGVSLRAEVQALSRVMVTQQCQVAYYSASNLLLEGAERPLWYRSTLSSLSRVWGAPIPDLPPRFRFIYMHLIAMWAGISANIPVVNGYSGYSPIGYDPHPDLWRSPELVIKWLQSQQAAPIDRLCFIRDRMPNSPDDSASDSPYWVEILRYAPHEKK